MPTYQLEVVRQLQAADLPPALRRSLLDGLAVDANEWFLGAFAAAHLLLGSLAHDRRWHEHLPPRAVWEGLGRLQQLAAELEAAAPDAFHSVPGNMHGAAERGEAQAAVPVTARQRTQQCLQPSSMA